MSMILGMSTDPHLRSLQVFTYGPLHLKGSPANSSEGVLVCRHHLKEGGYNAGKASSQGEAEHPNSQQEGREAACVSYLLKEGYACQ